MSNPFSPIHDAPHRPRDVYPIGSGLAVAFEISERKDHARIVLLEGEGGASEVLVCLESGRVRSDDDWGLSASVAAWIAADVAWHAMTGNGPGIGCEKLEIGEAVGPIGERVAEAGSESPS